MKSVFIKPTPRILRLNQFEMQWGMECCHPLPDRHQVKHLVCLCWTQRGRVLKALPLVSAFTAAPRILLLWLATFTLTMQFLHPHPLSCILLTVQQHFQRILKHNTFYFSVLVKIYESTKCTPAGNYIPLENAFTEGWNLIRKQSEILRGSQLPILLFQCSNHPNLGTQYFLTCEGRLLCYNI